ncbi:MAG: phosphatase PAP2-related protein [Nanoarchaeota archaeon]
MSSLTIFGKWKKDISNNKGKIVLSILFLVFALGLTMISGWYVDKATSTSVNDIILDHIPVVNLTFLFTWGIVLVIVIFLLYSFIYTPKKIHYSIGMLSLFLAIRSGFLILTHLKAPVGAFLPTEPGTLEILTYSNDLFFSGHAGIPFLGFLIFKNKKVKYFMLVASIILATTVLLMHLHYSIDVASAYFITFGIYKLGNKLFGENQL